MAANSRPSVERAGDREKALETALVQIERQFGKGSVMRLGQEAHVPVEVIPTGSISLDVALGLGGLPRGRIVEIYGPESSGKTTLALHALANAQKAGGIAAFIDAEHALDPDYAKKLGVDTDALLVSQPDTGEQALEIMDMLIRSGAIDIVVVDSVAALVPRAEIEGEMGDSHVGLQARLMSQALRKITGALSHAQTTAIFINQLREKVGVMFGCASWYSTKVTLADGTQGEDRQDRQSADGRSRCFPMIRKRGRCQSRRRSLTGSTTAERSEFLHFTVEQSWRGNGSWSCTLLRPDRNHLVRTPGRLARSRGASSLVIGSCVAQHALLSTHAGAGHSRVAYGRRESFPKPVRKDDESARFRMGHGAKQGGLSRLEDIAASEHPALPDVERQGCRIRRLHPTG